MVITLLPIVISSKLEQVENALLPICVTLSDTIMLFIFVQPENEVVGILVPPFITTVCNDAGTAVTAVPNILIKFLLVAGNVMLVKPLQPENALPSILVTVAGIVKLVRPLQPENALLPTFVTLA